MPFLAEFDATGVIAAFSMLLFSIVGSATYVSIMLLHTNESLIIQRAN